MKKSNLTFDVNSDIKNFLSRYGFTPNQLLGQNFLVDEVALEKIVAAAAIKPKDEVLEIGPGIGNLTALLAKKTEHVLAVEKDERYADMLKLENVRVEYADVTRFNFQAILKPGYKVVANIPYYITGKIIEMLVTAHVRPSRIVLLVQKEVAERIVAKPGALSILAISVQLWCSAKIVGDVPKESFYPQPKVDSAILQLDVLPKMRIAVEENKFFSIVRATFAGKRKQLRNTLKSNLKLDESSLEKVGKVVDLTLRPQDLTFEQWLAIYQRV